MAVILGLSLGWLILSFVYSFSWMSVSAAVLLCIASTVIGTWTFEEVTQ